MAIEIIPADKRDLANILMLQKACYHPEASLYNDFTIPPYVQNFESVVEEFNRGLFLKAMLQNNILGSPGIRRKYNLLYW